MANPKRQSFKVVEAPVVIEPQGVTVTPVFGPMVHLELDRRIEGPTTFDGMDAWLECQIDAGKLQQC